MAIPENIEQLANDIRTKIYGREVRESLAKGIEEAGSIADEANTRSKSTETKQTSLEKKYDEQIANMSLENPSMSEVVDARVSGYDGQNFDTIGKRMDKVDAQLARTSNEIVDARGGEAVLKNRLDKVDQKYQDVTTQLAQIANINVKNLGAIGDGIVDDTQAFIEAINIANTTGDAVILIPKGVYKIPNGDILPEIVNHDIYIKGMGLGVTTLMFEEGTYFKFGKNTGLVERGGISDLTIRYPFGHDKAESLVVLTKNCSGQRYDNLRLLNIPTFLQAGTTEYKAYSQRLTKVSVASANIGKPCIKLVNGAGFYWEDGSGGFVSGVNHPAGEDDMTTLEGTNFLDIVGNWDTVRLSNFCERWHKVINIQAPVGTTILNITIHNSFYDYIRHRCVDIQSNGGTIATFDLNNCVMNSWENDAINVFSTGFCRWVELKNVVVQFSGRFGIIFGGNVRDFRVLGGRIGRIGRKTTGTGIQVNNLKGFEIKDVVLGGIDSAGQEMKTSLQIIGNETDEYIISGCRAFRYEISLPPQEEQYSSKKRLVTDNKFIGNEPAYTYDGYKSTGRYVLPSSGTAWHNTTPFKIEVHIFGGTITSLVKDNATLSNNGASFELSPGQSFFITYTAAPTIRFYVKA